MPRLVPADAPANWLRVAEGLAPHRLAREMDTTPSFLRQKMEAFGYPLSSALQRWVETADTELRPVEAARPMFEVGITTYAELAKRFGVSNIRGVWGMSNGAADALAAASAAAGFPLKHRVPDWYSESGAALVDALRSTELSAMADEDWFELRRRLPQDFWDTVSKASATPSAAADVIERLSVAEGAMYGKPRTGKNRPTFSCKKTAEALQVTLAAQADQRAGHPSVLHSLSLAASRLASGPVEAARKDGRPALADLLTAVFSPKWRGVGGLMAEKVARHGFAELNGYGVLEQMYKAGITGIYAVAFIDKVCNEKKKTGFDKFETAALLLRGYQDVMLSRDELRLVVATGVLPDMKALKYRLVENAAKHQDTGFGRVVAEDDLRMRQQVLINFVRHNFSAPISSVVVAETPEGAEFSLWDSKRRDCDGDIPSKVYLNNQGTAILCEWLDGDDCLHRLDGPALVALSIDTDTNRGKVLDARYFVAGIAATETVVRAAAIHRGVTPATPAGRDGTASLAWAARVGQSLEFHGKPGDYADLVEMVAASLPLRRQPVVAVWQTEHGEWRGVVRGAASGGKAAAETLPTLLAGLQFDLVGLCVGDGTAHGLTNSGVRGVLSGFRNKDDGTWDCDFHPDGGAMCVLGAADFDLVAPTAEMLEALDRVIPQPEAAPSAGPLRR